MILVGDLNAYPDSRALEILGQRWNNATAKTAKYLTFPSVAPKNQIDYVVYQPQDSRLVSGKAVVINESLASDHCPLVVDFTFSDSDR